MSKFSKIPGIGITMKPVGNWVGLQSYLRSLPANLASSAAWGQRKAAERLIKIVKGHIDTQDLHWAPKKKPRLSNDPRVLVDTEKYRNSIKTWQVNGKRMVGVPKDINNSQGIPVYKYAAYHEHRSYTGGPYRALWGPSIDEMGGANGIASIITEVINKKIRLNRL